MTALDPCRPFTDAEVIRAERITTSGGHDHEEQTILADLRESNGWASERAATDLELAIDRAQQWATRYLNAVIRLAHWGPYLAEGGPQPVVAARVMAAATEVEEGADALAVIVADLRRAAEAVQP